MKTRNLLLSIFILNFIFILDVRSQCTGWANTAAGQSANSAFGITLDEQNNSYVAGFYYGPTTFGNVTFNDYGTFVIKYDSLGNQLWVKGFHGNFLGPFAFISYSNSALFFMTTFYDTAIFASTTLTTSNFSGIAVVKLNTDGDVQWAKTFSCTSISSGYGIRNTASGKVLLTGRYRGTLSMGGFTLTGPASGYCIYLAELNASSGNVLWANSSTVQASNNGGRGYAIRTDLQGNILLSGYYQNIIQFGNQSLDNSSYPIGFAPYVSKFDSNGTCIWIRGGTGPATFCNVYGLTIDSLNNVYFSCPFDSVITFSGNIFSPANGNFVIGKYDAAGNMLWVKQWGSHITDSISLVASLHIDHNNILTAYGWGVYKVIFEEDTLTSAGGFDIFKADFDVSGNYLSSFITGNIYDENFYDAAYDIEDHACVAGCFYGDTTTLANFGLHSDADFNSFVWKNCDAVTGIGTKLVRENQISIYPNPSSEFINFDLGNFPNETLTFTIYNSSGQQAQLFNNLHSSQLKIPVSQLGADGLYFYTVSFEDQKIFAGKFMVQR